jgi:hypothetical protein
MTAVSPKTRSTFNSKVFFHKVIEKRAMLGLMRDDVLNKEIGPYLCAFRGATFHQDPTSYK